MRGSSAAQPISPVSTWRAPFLAILAIAVLYAATPMAQALDTWTALACGRHIAAHGVDDADPFSYASRPTGGSFWLPTGWINQNWLTHLLLYLLVKAFGTGALAVARVAVYGGVAVALFAAQRLAGVREPLAATVAALALLLARPTLEIRPQDFTNLLVAVELVVLAAWTQRSSRALWLAVPLFALWGNLHGGFVFGFVLLLVVAAGRLVGERLGRRLPPGGAVRPAQVALVTAAALAACVLASPYRLANLTHPLVISVSRDAASWRLIEEWRPFFEGGLDVRNQWYFVTWIGVLVVGATVALKLGRVAPVGSRRDARAHEVPRKFPDLAGLAVAAVTIAMTLQSRRFIPVAVIATAPALGTWIESAVAGREARRSEPPGPTARRRVAFAAVAVGAALALTWAWRFATVYLAPWPHAAGATPVFERMSWAHRRPVGACRFMKANGLEGRILNAWVDGGYLEWCQTPSASGAPPLMTAIDGRAQGAFSSATHRRYLEIWSGGPAGLASDAARAAWVDATLKLDGVHLVLIPDDEARSGVARALLTRGNWQVVFLAPTHVLYADTDDPRGRRLASGVLDGSTAFPDEATRRLTRAFRLLALADEASVGDGLREAEAAFAASPSAMAVQTARRALAFPPLAGPFRDFARRVLEGHLARGERDEREGGTLLRNGAAIVAGEALAELAEHSGEVTEAGRLRSVVADLRAARERVWRRALW